MHPPDSSLPIRNVNILSSELPVLIPLQQRERRHVLVQKSSANSCQERTASHDVFVNPDWGPLRWDDGSYSDGDVCPAGVGLRPAVIPKTTAHIKGETMLQIRRIGSLIGKVSHGSAEKRRFEMSRNVLSSRVLIAVVVAFALGTGMTAFGASPAPAKAASNLLTRLFA